MRAALVALLAFACAACTTPANDATQILVTIDAKDAARAASSVRLRVLGGPSVNKLVLGRVVDIPVGDGWPIEFVIDPKGGDESRLWKVEAWALRGGREVGAATAQGGFAKGKLLERKLVLTPGVDLGPVPGLKADAGAGDAAVDAAIDAAVRPDGGAAGSPAVEDGGNSPSVALGCKPNPKPTEACKQSCPEVCNKIDDDCDGRIDEDADASCDGANGVEEAACLKGLCIAVTCVDGYRDCDDLYVNGCEAGPTDANNCGGCGQRCRFGNATGACVAGACEQTGCNELYADCNADDADCEVSLETTTDCGACGVPCTSSPNAKPGCLGGVCGPGTCDPGFGNCNKLPADGCESPLDTVADCGGCGAACDLVGSSSDVCAIDKCLAGACDSGFGDCDGNRANGCEALVGASDCGACGQHCDPSLPNAASADCATGTCDVACKAGFDDCDANPFDGCETSVTTNTRCGACNMPCAIPSAIVSCTTGSCAFVRCQDGYGNCNNNVGDGCETTLDQVSHCGSCLSVCASPNPYCAGGRCTSEICAPGTADCNLDGMTCEVTLATDPLHCGDCALACGFNVGSPNASGLQCLGGTCVPTCEPGFADCNGNYSDGCEVSTTTATDCGACGVPCAIANATATCATGQCRVEQCDTDRGDCNTDLTSCETQLTTLTNCGRCGLSCDLPNALETCGGTSGAHACEIEACASSQYADCDGFATNGCEMDLHTSANCGGCANLGLNEACTNLPNVAATACPSGSCAISQCSADWLDCDGNLSNGCEQQLSVVGPCFPDTGCTKQVYQGSSYFSCTNSRTWAAARAQCQQQLLGDLVHIREQAENDFVQAYVAGASPWIGASDLAAEGAWRWADDSTAFWTGAAGGAAVGGLFSKWNSGEPNDSGGNEDCASMLGTGSGAAIGKWKDGPCTATLPFVCKVQSDLCPSDPTKILPGQCDCGTPDTDSDGDGTANCNDGCVADPNKTAAGACGCGVDDGDGDGFEDCAETCDADPLKTSPGLCGCGVPDTNTDGDSLPDCSESCDTDPLKTAPGLCGCGTTDINSDGDSEADCNESCDSDPLKTAPGLCGCGTLDTNTDSDSQPDCSDGCDTDPLKLLPGVCGCGSADTNTDGDSQPDCNDGCPTNANKIAPGTCGCGVNDTDNDGIEDCVDGCPLDGTKTAAGQCGCGVTDTDSDGDSTANCNDGCPLNNVTTVPPCEYCKKLTVGQLYVDADLTNFPMLVRITDSDLKTNARTDGQDIRFTSAAAGNLDHELESYASASGALVAWTRVTSLSGTVNTDITMHYGDGAIHAENVGSTWEPGYGAVWHLQENPAAASSLQDSSGNARHQIAGGLNTSYALTPTTDAASLIGSGVLFNANDEWVSFGSVLNTGTVLTASTWWKPSALTAESPIIANGSSNTASWTLGGGLAAGKFLARVRNGVAATYAESPAGTVSVSAWHHLAMVYDGAGAANIDKLKLYYDGAPVSVTFTGTLPTSFAVGGTLRLGALPWAAGYGANGSVDEVHVSTASRSAAWIKAEYENQKSPSPFFTLGAQIACTDNCLGDPLKTDPGVCGCGVPDADTDNDGTKDCVDGCVSDIAKTAPGACGCGVADTDTDGDGFPDCMETCDADPLKQDPGACGCGTQDVDSDGDLTPNCVDGCPFDASSTQAPCTAIVYRKQFSIAAAKVSTNLTNFPVLVSITDASLQTFARADGLDIRFYDSTGTTLLSFEIESFTKATGALLAWVRLPTLFTASATAFYMHYGDDNATNLSNADTTWETNYKAVYHMKYGGGAAGTELDMSGNANNAPPDSGGTCTTAQTAPVNQPSGRIGAALTFGGNTCNRLLAPASASLDFASTSSMTMSFWVKAGASPTQIQPYIAQRARGITTANYDVGTNTTTGYALTYLNSANHNPTTAVAVDSGAWTYVTVTVASVDATTGTCTFYKNGSPPASNTATGCFLGTTAGLPLFIGGFDNTSDEYVKGDLDEVHIANTARSAAWIKAEYDNQSSPSTFYTLNITPTISGVSNQTINEDAATSALAISVGDVETAAASLTMSGTSSNTTLVPNANIVFGGSGASRTVTVTPAFNQSGTATITLRVTDAGGAFADEPFILTVNGVNDGPSISNVVDQTINQNAPTAALAIAVSDIDTAVASLTMSGSSSNTTLVPNANLIFGGSGATRTVTVVPAPDQGGTTTITLTVSDGTATAVDTFILTVLNNGKTCASGGTCDSGNCVDGVCCNTTCGGGVSTDCQACSMAAGGPLNGTCSAVTAASSTVCRASAGGCDAAELCPGVSSFSSNVDSTAWNFTSSPTWNCTAAGTTTIDSTGGTATCPAITGDTCGGTATLDCTNNLVQTDAGGPNVMVVRLRGLTVSGNHVLLLRGDKPIIFLVDGNVLVDTGGRIDAGAAGVTRGAGGSIAGQCTAQTGGTTTNTAHGGGGGGFGTAGGAGGGPGGTAGAVSADVDLQPLRGGCSGGTGGNGATAAGAGGGAVQISATGTITVGTGANVGTVSAAGGGGVGASTNSRGGGGGGSGGAIRLEAPSTPVFGTSGAARAHGGGGGEGISLLVAGSAGANGASANNTPAAGGSGGTAGDGGNGGLCAGPNCATASAAGIAGTLASGEGGGGGGGGGRVQVVQRSSSNGLCPADVVATNGTVCRAAVDVCDLAEACNGASATCPASDSKQPNNTPCTADANPCSQDKCDGSNDACQHPAGNAGAVCRAAVGGGCDAQETCNGSSPTCPADLVATNGTVCRGSVGVCDPAAEVCDGIVNTCPADIVAGGSTVCRASVGVCDPVAETCGGSNSCPADTYTPGTSCRPAVVGGCDIAESCFGGSTACPADAVVPNSTVCRAIVAGGCDPVAETCNGVANTCPVDTFASNTTACRGQTNICDATDFCTGTSSSCPADAFAPVGDDCGYTTGAVTIYATGLPTNASYLNSSFASGSITNAGPTTAWPDAMKFTATSSASAANYLYWRFSTTARTFAASDLIEYDVYLADNQISIGGLDVETASGALRDAVVGPGIDQNLFNSHPITDISAKAFGKWYHRRYALSGLGIVGKTSTNWTVADENKTNSATYTAYFDNVIVAAKPGACDGANICKIKTGSACTIGTECAAGICAVNVCASP